MQLCAWGQSVAQAQAVQHCPWVPVSGIGPGSAALCPGTVSDTGPGSAALCLGAVSDTGPGSAALYVSGDSQWRRPRQCSSVPGGSQ